MKKIFIVVTFYSLNGVAAFPPGEKIFTFQRRADNQPWSTCFFQPTLSILRNHNTELLVSRNKDPVYDDVNTIRRNLLRVACGSLTALASVESAQALPNLFGRLQQQQKPNKAELYVVGPERNQTTTELIPDQQLSSELCLVKLLPVKNKYFQKLASTMEHLSFDNSDATRKLLLDTIQELDKRRSSLEPVFNPEDETVLQIGKAERGERLVESFRQVLVRLCESCAVSASVDACEAQQKEALLALSQVGELLVATFPYDVPTEGKYSYLPRLLGRAKVTFTIQRDSKLLGNITIVADGYTAPITAGNFVDLSLRNFFTGLPIKFTKKRIGSGNEFDVAQIPIFGSYRDGFYDPLTARPRRLPLEIIRVEAKTGVPNLAYSLGLTNLVGQATLEPTSQSKPLLSFTIPGIVAMNHLDRANDGASSEFFALQQMSMQDDRRHLLDGEYAPFGFITEGFNLFQTIQPNDIIDETFVDEWGQLSLVKLRQSSFSEAAKGPESEKEQI